ncbi:SF1B family DNA helicase RecD2 [Butyrivibrio sp. AC2005]|uniref:SF1B family DNA helicase RecD2 n=1 Tax=Butyrivibrio sp. AC2005 TaxID=1280672 RepID=UPI000405A2E7|nr:AAA family ATPase [Butyrivibrio sp. AC2005]
MHVKFKYRVYFDEASGYSVCQYRDIDTGKKVTCVGNNLPIIKNISYEFVTEEFSTAKYGKSYRVISWEEFVNRTEEDIVAYLSCGMFRGISKKIAQSIYDAFGENTISVLDSDIDRLITIPGIGKKTLEKIKKSYIEKRASREIAAKLIKYGISINAINRIYEAYKADALKIIEEDPYELCNIRGITFLMADMIAKDNNFADDSYERVKAASNYVLTEDMMYGNVCMPKKDYAIKLLRVLNTSKITRKNILDYVLKMIKDGTVRYNKRVTPSGKREYFYYPLTYKTERDIASRIKALLSHEKRHVPNIDALIDKYAGDIKLDETQREAVRVGVTEPVFVITGGPGTGKTTILKIIAQINEELNGGNDNNVFLSPTGRAARRITESTGFPAKTIHSALGLGIVDDERFADEKRFHEECLKDVNVIVDEASMIDLWTMNGLLRNIKDSTLGLVGDTDQLPSVRCGSILRDLIQCGAIPCVQLDTIHRQSADALNICENAQNIKNGIHMLSTGDDFHIIETETLENAEENLIESALKQIYLYGNENVKVLCPFKKGACGVYRVNTILQNELNPSKGDTELKIPNDMVLRAGDPVMQLKNIEDVANGDVGYVLEITHEEVKVLFSGENPVSVEYSYTDAKEQLTLAYATTVHKSQGSEFDSVILCLTPKHGLMKKRNILYTGITRGKHQVTLIGTYEAFYESIDNNMIEDRHSMLAELIGVSESSSKPETKVVPIPQKQQYEQMALPFV